MAGEHLLTAEELAYLTEVTSNAAGRKQKQAHASPSFRVEGNWEASELLTRLAANCQLSLDAAFGRFCLSFPLTVVEDEFHSLHLELSPPTIYEDGPKSRVWRLQLSKPLPLLEADGGRSSLRVRELSPNGLVVDTLRRKPAPEHFHLHLPLPDGEALPVSAHRVRVREDGLTAYEVEFAEAADTERLRRFIFTQHLRLHPELRPDVPAHLV